MKYAIYNKVRLSLTLSLGLTLSLLLSSCSNISEDERLIYVKPASVNRSVLIEDFTGQRCVNCPNATDEIHRLQEQYGEEAVIAVGIHSGPFGHRTTMSSPLLPLATETGDYYYNHWGVEQQPCAMINRNGKLLYAVTEYAVEVRKVLAEVSPLELSVVNVSINEGKADVLIKCLSLTDAAIEGKIQVWLVEDNIVNTQYMPDGSIDREYLHQHVFRTSLTTDLMGDAYHIAPGEVKNSNFSVELDESWVKENIRVVAFVYNDSDGVIQVVSSPLIQIIDNEDLN